MKPSREQIIAWAREAGFTFGDACQIAYCFESSAQGSLTRFAELARAGESEPVAWCDLTTWPKTAWPDDCFSDTPIEGWTPLYTHPTPSPAARVPMTLEQIEELLGEANRGFDIEREHYLKAFRDAEKAHGITAKEQS